MARRRLFTVGHQAHAALYNTHWILCAEASQHVHAALQSTQLAQSKQQSMVNSEDGWGKALAGQVC